MNNQNKSARRPSIENIENILDVLENLEEALAIRKCIIKQYLPYGDKKNNENYANVILYNKLIECLTHLEKL